MNCEPYSRRQLVDDEIPHLLQKIYTPPEQLWIEGRLPADHKYLCVVGSRRHSAYGREACEQLIAGLAGYPVCIVSGLAIGIDSITHQAALDAGLPTIAFPGSGLDRDVLYPATHRPLAEKILAAGGALLSEFDLWQTAAPWTFPQRNRLMAGISDATLIIEASEKSGTLITAAHAREENREVLALPGQIFSPVAQGPNDLIRDGAAVIRSSLDILYALGLKEKEQNLGPNQHLGTKNNNKDSPKLHSEIVSLVSVEALDRDSLAERLGVDITAITIAVSELEMYHRVVERGGKIVIDREFD